MLSSRTARSTAPLGRERPRCAGPPVPRARIIRAPLLWGRDRCPDLQVPRAASLGWDADMREWALAPMALKQQRRGKTLADTVAVGLEQTSLDGLFVALQALQSAAQAAQPSAEHMSALSALLHHLALLLEEGRPMGDAAGVVAQEEALLPRLEAFVEACGTLGTVAQTLDGLEGPWAPLSEPFDRVVDALAELCLVPACTAPDPSDTFLGSPDGGCGSTPDYNPAPEPASTSAAPGMRRPVVFAATMSSIAPGDDPFASPDPFISSSPPASPDSLVASYDEDDGPSVFGRMFSSVGSGSTTHAMHRMRRAAVGKGKAPSMLNALSAFALSAFFPSLHASFTPRPARRVAPEEGVVGPRAARPMATRTANKVVPTPATPLAEPPAMSVLPTPTSVASEAVRSNASAATAAITHVQAPATPAMSAAAKTMAAPQAQRAASPLPASARTTISTALAAVHTSSKPARTTTFAPAVQPTAPSASMAPTHAARKAPAASPTKRQAASYLPASVAQPSLPDLAHLKRELRKGRSYSEIGVAWRLGAAQLQQPWCSAMLKASAGNGADMGALTCDQVTRSSDRLARFLKFSLDNNSRVKAPAEMSDLAFATLGALDAAVARVARDPSLITDAAGPHQGTGTGGLGKSVSTTVSVCLQLAAASGASQRLGSVTALTSVLNIPLLMLGMERRSLASTVASLREAAARAAVLSAQAVDAGDSAVASATRTAVQAANAMATQSVARMSEVVQRGVASLKTTMQSLSRTVPQAVVGEALNASLARHGSSLGADGCIDIMFLLLDVSKGSVVPSAGAWRTLLAALASEQATGIPAAVPAAMSNGSQLAPLAWYYPPSTTIARLSDLLLALRCTVSDQAYIAHGAAAARVGSWAALPDISKQLKQRLVSVGGEDGFVVPEAVWSRWAEGDPEAQAKAEAVEPMDLEQQITIGSSPDAWQKPSLWEAQLAEAVKPRSNTASRWISGSSGGDVEDEEVGRAAQVLAAAFNDARARCTAGWAHADTLHVVRRGLGPAGKAADAPTVMVQSAFVLSVLAEAERLGQHTLTPELQHLADAVQPLSTGGSTTTGMAAAASTFPSLQQREAGPFTSACMASMHELPLPQLMAHLGLQPSSVIPLEQLLSLVQVARWHAHVVRGTKPLTGAPALSDAELAAVTTMVDLSQAAVNAISKRPGVRSQLTHVVPQVPKDPVLELFKDSVEVWGDNVRSLLKRLKQTELGKWPAADRVALGLLSELAGAFPAGAMGAPHVELLQALDTYMLLYHRAYTDADLLHIMQGLHKALAYASDAADRVKVELEGASPKPKGRRMARSTSSQPPAWKRFTRTQAGSSGPQPTAYAVAAAASTLMDTSATATASAVGSSPPVFITPEEVATALARAHRSSPAGVVPDTSSNSSGSSSGLVYAGSQPEQQEAAQWISADEVQAILFATAEAVHGTDTGTLSVASNVDPAPITSFAMTNYTSTLVSAEEVAAALAAIPEAKPAAAVATTTHKPAAGHANAAMTSSVSGAVEQAGSSQMASDNALNSQSRVVISADEVQAVLSAMSDKPEHMMMSPDGSAVDAADLFAEAQADAALAYNPLMSNPLSAPFGGLMGVAPAKQGSKKATVKPAAPAVPAVPQPAWVVAALAVLHADPHLVRKPGSTAAQMEYEMALKEVGLRLAGAAVALSPVPA